MKRKYLSLLALLLISVLVLGCQNATTASISNNGPDKAKPAATADNHDDDAPRITLVDAKAAYDDGTAIFVDTRAESSYKQEHVKGAINISADQLDAKIKELPKDKKMIAYCSWPNEHTSASLVSQLKKKGFDNAYAMIGGTAIWKQAGYPMEKSE